MFGMNKRKPLMLLINTKNKVIKLQRINKNIMISIHNIMIQIMVNILDMNEVFVKRKMKEYNRIEYRRFQYAY